MDLRAWPLGDQQVLCCCNTQQNVYIVFYGWIWEVTSTWKSGKPNVFWKVATKWATDGTSQQALISKAKNLALSDGLEPLRLPVSEANNTTMQTLSKWRVKTNLPSILSPLDGAAHRALKELFLRRVICAFDRAASFGAFSTQLFWLDNWGTRSFRRGIPPRCLFPGYGVFLLVWLWPIPDNLEYRWLQSLQNRRSLRKV